MQEPTVAYLLGFAGLCVVALAVALAIALSSASSWRRRSRRKDHRNKTDRGKWISQMSRADNDMQDALAYQKRNNEAVQARVRKAEESAQDNAAAAAANAELLEQSQEAAARLAATYAGSTEMIGSQALGIAAAAEEARKQALSRAEANTLLLRELESDIQAMYNRAATPADVNAEVARLEAELQENVDRNREASDNFYRTVATLLSTSEEAQRETGEEIALMYATKAEAEEQASGLLAEVASAQEELQGSFESALQRAGEVEAECGLRNAGELDAAALDAVRESYDEVLARLADYTAVLDQNEAQWAALDERVLSVEGTVSASQAAAAAADAEVGAALSDLDAYIRTQCTPQSAVDGLEADLREAAAAADALAGDVADALATCQATRDSCERADATCLEAQGSAAVNLAEGGQIEVDGIGTLSIREGDLQFCGVDGPCTLLSA